MHGIKNRINNVMSCCIDLHYSLFYLDDFHPQWYFKRGLLRFLSSFRLCLFLSYVNLTVIGNLSLTFSYVNLTKKKEFLTNLLSEKYASKKCDPGKPTNRTAGFPKPKAHFLLTVVTTFFSSNKTRYSYFKWRNCRGKRLL